MTIGCLPSGGYQNFKNFNETTTGFVLSAGILVLFDFVAAVATVSSVADFAAMSNWDLNIPYIPFNQKFYLLNIF